MNVDEIDRNDGKKLPINERIKKKNVAERASVSPPPVRKVLHLEKSSKSIITNIPQKPLFQNTEQSIPKSKFKKKNRNKLKNLGEKKKWLIYF